MYWVILLTICVGLIIIIIFMPFIVGSDKKNLGFRGIMVRKKKREEEVK